jgi:hypothetical protein
MRFSGLAARLRRSNGSSTRGQRIRAVAAGLVLALLGGVVVATTAAEPAAAATVVCDGSAANDQNDLRVTPSHGTVFYIDSGQGQQLDAAYAAYRVTNTSGSTARDDLWVQVDGFTGGVVQLANPADSSQPLGDVAASASATSYTLLKATASTTLAQSHVVHVYEGMPGTTGATELYRCTYTFNEVAETIKAAANKVTDLTTTTSTVIGSTMVVTVEGNTGTIGAGNDLDGSMMWFSPAARSSWPTGALRLESTQVDLYTNNGRTNLSGSYVNQLHIPTTSGSKFYYTATYTFRIIGSSAVPAAVVPIAQISSGTQIKHTDLASISSSTLGTDTATVAVAVTKVTSPTVVVADGVSTFSYTVTFANSGSAVTLDSLTDTRSAGLEYVPGSGVFNGSATSDPTVVPGDSESLVFSGPFPLNAGTSGSPSTRTLTYQMSIPTCAETFHFTNSATAGIGSVIIGSGSSSISVSNAVGTCGATVIDTYTENETLPLEATTSPATSIGTTTAHLNGLVDPNGTSGEAISFSYGTDPDLTGATTVAVGTTTTATTPYAVGADLTGLTPGTTYYFRVTAGSAVGDILSFVTTETVGTPTVETTGATGVTSGGLATFNGFIDPNQVTNGAKVKFQYATDSSGGACTSLGSISVTGFAQSETETSTTDAIYTGSFPSAASMALTGLTSGARYCFRIVGYYNASTANWATSVAGDWMPVLISTKTAQTITFPAIADAVIGDAPNAAATASSSLTVTYTSNTPEVCTVSPTGAIVLLTAGTCSITASQDGNDAYTAATPVTVNFEVSKAPQTISFSPTTTVTAGDTVPLEGTSTSGLTVSYTAGPADVCTIVAGELVTGPESGVCTVEATQPGNDSYLAATPVSVAITVNPGPPVVTTTALADGVIGAAYDENLAAAGGNGTYSSWTITAGALPTGLTIDSATGRIHGIPTVAGEVTLTVTVVSASLTSVEQEVTLRIGKKTPTITASDITVTYGDADSAVGASTDSGGTLTIDPADSSIVTVTGGTLHIVGAGTTTLHLVSVETDEYAEATLDVTVTVDRAELTVTAPSPSVTYGDPAPTYVPSVSGFVLTDDLTSLTSSPTCSSSYTAGSTAGSAPAVVCLGAAADNYDIVYVDGVVTIAKAPQTITIAPDAPVDMPPGSTQNLAVSALGDGVPSVSTTGPCTWDAGILTSDATEGECVVSVSVPASTNHLAAGPVTRTLQVTVAALIPRSLELELDVPGTEHTLVAVLNLIATVGPVPATPTLTVDAGSASVCQLESDGSITLLAVGECVINGSIDADTVYGAATATLSFDVTRISRTLALAIAAPTAKVGGTVVLTATPSAGGGTITYRLADLAGHCSLAGNVLTALSVGTCDVVADIAADDRYLTATSTTERLRVLAAPAPAAPPAPPADDPDEDADPDEDPVPTPTPTPSVPTVQPVSTTEDDGFVIVSAGRLPQPSPGVGTPKTGVSSTGFRSASELAGEVLGGFAAGTGAIVQVTGARTAAQFIVDPTTIGDPLALVAALDESSLRLTADFAALTSTEVTDRPGNDLLLGGQVSYDARAVFEAAGLASPILVDDLGVGDATRWIIVRADADGYVPGSVVYLVVTTQPVIVAATVVDRHGSAELVGAIPADLFTAGAHDLRVVGTRVLTGATANADGEITLSTQAMDDIQRFDAGTWATVEISGTAANGGSATAVRVVLLGLEAPWWTVITLGALGLLLLGLLLWRRPELTRWRVLAAVLLTAGIALPAILGWLSRSYDVVLFGVIVGLLAAVLAFATRFAGIRRSDEHGAHSAHTPAG